MARTIGKLTALAATQAKRRGYYGDGGGLFLQVSGSGSKSWVFRFREGGRLREMGLGPTHTVSLAEARQKGLDCRKARLDGKDPIADRKAAPSAARLEAAKAMTFKDCAERYIAAPRAGWRNPKHAAQWPSTLAAYVYAVLGSLPGQVVDVGLVMKALEPSGPRSLRRPAGFAGASSRCSTTRRRVAGGRARTPRGGAVISKTCYRRKAKVRRVEHHAALPYAEAAPSWLRCGGRRAFPPERSNLRS